MEKGESGNFDTISEFVIYDGLLFLLLDTNGTATRYKGRLGDHMDGYPDRRNIPLGHPGLANNTFL